MDAAVAGADTRPPRMVMRLHILRGSFCAGAGAGAGGSGISMRRARASRHGRKRRIRRRVGGVDACGGAGGGGPGGPAMDASVWSRLPEDLVWRVLLLVPAVKRFQLHLVSRRWRQELTSPHFCTAIKAMAMAASESPWMQQQQRDPERVLACATPVHAYPRSQFRVVEVDLSFVPSWFWKAGCPNYSVVAAGDGLVCITNNMDFSKVLDFTSDKERWRLMALCRSQPNRYCVLNPVTRTCVVLPPLPFQPAVWLPPAAGAVTVCGGARGFRLRAGKRDCEMATFDLASGTGGRWARAPAGPRVLAHCAGQTFRYDAARSRLHVQEALAGPGAATEKEASASASASGAKRRRLGEAPAPAPPPPPAAVQLDTTDLDGPSVALLGLDAAQIGYVHKRVYVVPHLGALHFVAQLMVRDRFFEEPEHVAGVWRLARHDGAGVGAAGVAWKPVSLLGLDQAEALVGGDATRRSPFRNFKLRAAFSVRNLLCCEFTMSTDIAGLPTLGPFVVGLDLGTGEWELVVADDALVYEHSDVFKRKCATPFELRPDLYV